MIFHLGHRKGPVNLPETISKSPWKMVGKEDETIVSFWVSAYLEGANS